MNDKNDNICRNCGNKLDFDLNGILDPHTGWNYCFCDEYGEYTEYQRYIDFENYTFKIRSKI